MALTRSRLAPALLVAAVLAACSTEEQPPAQAAAGPGEGGKGRAIAVQCQEGAAIEAEARAAVQGQARTLYQALRDGRTDVLWDDLHPQARRDDQREPFMEALAAMQGRLEGAPATPALESVHVVDLDGGANDLAQVQCGAEDDPGRFTLLVNAGGEDVAVVVLRASTGAIEHAVTVQLRQREVQGGQRWHLLGIQVNPTAYRGKQAIDYEQMADVYMAQQQVVMGYLLLGLAQTLSDRGASVTSAAHARIEDKLGAIQHERLLAAETGIWAVGDARFRIEGISLVSTREEISPVIKYVSPQGLVEELLDRDAEALIEEVRRRFPDLAQHFDAVVFEAYAEAPTKPGQSYQAYRVVRYLDRNRPKG